MRGFARAVRIGNDSYLLVGLGIVLRPKLHYAGYKVLVFTYGAGRRARVAVAGIAPYQALTQRSLSDFEVVLHNPAKIGPYTIDLSSEPTVGRALPRSYDERRGRGRKPPESTLRNVF